MRAILAAFTLVVASVAAGAAYADGVEPAATDQATPAPTAPVPLWPTQVATTEAAPTLQAPPVQESAEAEAAKRADVATGAYDASLIVLRTGPARTSPYAFGAAGASTGRR